VDFALGRSALNYDLLGFGLLLEHGKPTRHQAVAPDALLVTNVVALLSALDGGCVEALGLVLDTLGNGERSLPGWRVAWWRVASPCSRSKLKNKRGTNHLGTIMKEVVATSLKNSITVLHTPKLIY
jgi:membrane protein required for beta-lactamase induction